MDPLKLPPHIHKVSDKWYQNTETDKFIHADRIEKVCENYWMAIANRGKAVTAKIKYTKNFKAAKKRWGL